MHTSTPATEPRFTANLRRTQRLWLMLVGVLTAIVLMTSVGDQIYDSNLAHLSKATALLAGDRPYRDFFDSGAPLPAHMSAVAQWVVGYRLLGEFVLQWTFIVAGVVLAFHLGWSLSRSIVSSLVTLALGLLILTGTPTYSYDKLFCFPLSIWAAWRYMDQPSPGRAAILGATAALGFLFRHDFGVYVGLASVVAFVLAWLAVPACRRVGLVAKNAAAYAAAVAIVLTPWAAVVQTSEGLLEYARTSATLYQQPRGFVYASLLRLNPVRALSPQPPPAPKRAVVGFVWNKERADETVRQQLERKHGLRALPERDADGRSQYEVANLYDVGLLDLEWYINDSSGFDWDRLREIRLRLPTRQNVELFLSQVALLIPVLLVVSGGWAIWRDRRRAEGVSPDAWRMVLAGVFLAAVDSSLFRQSSYMVAVAPVTAALGARFLVGRTMAGRAAAIAMLLLTGYAALVWARGTPLFRPPSQLAFSMRSGFRQLLASPPVYDDPWFHYLYHCTVPGDRLLITGPTPFHASYFAQRPMAGGHLYWRYGWRSDPHHEQQSLALILRQSVPFAYSTQNPVLVDFRQYPRIHEYLVTHYTPVGGSSGRLLVDKRRRPTRGYGPTALPCFR